MAATLDDILIAINNMTASQRSSTGGFSSKNVGDSIFDINFKISNFEWFKMQTMQKTQAMQKTIIKIIFKIVLKS